VQLLAAQLSVVHLSAAHLSAAQRICRRRISPACPAAEEQSPPKTTMMHRIQTNSTPTTMHQLCCCGAPR
jgi:hypothetical protein